jgi:hypothetical protein
MAVAGGTGDATTAAASVGRRWVSARLLFFSLHRGGGHLVGDGGGRQSGKSVQGRRLHRRRNVGYDRREAE